MHVLKASVVVTAGLLAAAPLLAAPSPAVPSPQEAVERACAKAGGLDAFRQLGVLEINVTSEEVTQDGHTSKSSKNLFVMSPGPIPGRLELPERNVVAGDDGQGGWAVVNERADSRPTTTFMVKRSLASFLFPILLPFSLTWQDVTVSGVTPASDDGRPVWRLAVVLPRTFFDSPQIATNWTIDLDRDTFALVRADSPATDLGKGLTADGMRFAWNAPVTLGGMRFFAEERVIGLDEEGHEKTHSRVDHLKFSRLPKSEATRLFANPIPLDQRPKPFAPPKPADKPGKPE
jgi:hypothetical protein